jgi:fucose 4-O-acetylase-like acetyltransferase
MASSAVADDSLQSLVAATPPTRDRYVDALRAAAILVVVLGHWLIAVITLDGGRVSADNALAGVPVLQWLTWAFQVMPLFFVVGGFANRAALERHGTADYLRSRVVRLVAPVAPLALTWFAVGPVLGAAGVSHRTVHLLTRTLGQPLWFLAVYLVVSALAPVLLRAHRRFGIRVPLALLAAVVAVDVLRPPSPLGYLNYLFVFLIAHQLGFLLWDGALLRLPRRLVAMTGGAALAVLVALTTVGGYPTSMVGVPGEARSNMSPPTVCIVVLTVLQLAVALLARPRAQRALQGRRLWTGVVAVNGSIMTIFLWHLSALAVSAAVLLGVLGFPQPASGTTAWWLTRVPWIAAAATVLVVLVVATARFERAGRRSPAGEPNVAVGAGAAALATAAMTVLALRGFELALAPVAATAALAATSRYLKRRRLIG